uniref:J domain-containing protein n=1 Tax=Aureoumbra lagunensis TaxID=44058 RepID=A0A7S3JSW6_9STRA|mmetsp:Transcript_8725/g.12107  ORF Transcript_8725/g.12107 Transcript_8725/m.12107 type:complete len:183 (+) Transcript_8725:36-584(+)
MTGRLSSRDVLREIMKARNHFETLQLPLSHLGCKDVRASYIDLCKRVHPDQCNDTEAELAFKKVSTAYQVLRCPQRRSQYLQVERDRERRDPHKSLELLEAIAKPWLLFTAVGLFFCAEFVRLNFGLEFFPIQEEEVLLPSSTTKSPPVSPAFSTNPGELLIGHSSQELADKLEQVRRRKKK